MSKNLEVKQQVVADIVEKLKNAESMVIVSYEGNGLTVEQVTELRKQCRENDVTYCVLKTRLVNRALEELKIEGIVMTMVDFRTNFTKDIAATVHQLYENIGVFNVVIPSSIKAVETSAIGASIYQHCPNVKVAKAYTELTKEVLNHEGN